MTQTELLELSHKWEDLYNSDAVKMALECYAENCVVRPMGGGTLRGNEKLAALERAIIEAAPRRYMRVAERHVAGDTVIVEAVLRDHDKGDKWQIPFIAVMTCKDGRVVEDRTYADWREWPGL
ncbi:MAG: nuclear transport factor 2 family protein [Myxococcales bacterium]|nr:nuclear transport factor 2 family protein [Myxococcales bacterium]